MIYYTWLHCNTFSKTTINHRYVKVSLVALFLINFILQTAQLFSIICALHISPWHLPHAAIQLPIPSFGAIAALAGTGVKMPSLVCSKSYSRGSNSKLAVSTQFLYCMGLLNYTYTASQLCIYSEDMLSCRSNSGR